MTGVSVAAVTRMLLGRGAGDRWIAVIGGFFDDSGTHNSSDLVVLGGLLGTEAQWDVFAPAWSALMANPLPEKPPLKEFHLTDCRAGFGEFINYREADRNRAEYLFRRVILDAGLFSLAVAVDKRSWDEIIVGSLVNELGTALECCFIRCIELIVNTARSRRRGEPIHLFFDQGKREELDIFSRLYMSQSEKYPELSGISFAPVSKVVALQGADMIANSTYQYGLKWLGNRQNTEINPHFRDFVARELSTGLILGREHIEEAAKLINEKRQVKS